MIQFNKMKNFNRYFLLVFILFLIMPGYVEGADIRLKSILASIERYINVHRAIKELKESLSKDPDNYNYYISLAYLYDGLHLYWREVSMTEGALEHVPDDNEEKNMVYVNLANNYKRI